MKVEDLTAAELGEHIRGGWRCVRFVRCTSYLIATVEHESRVYVTENWQDRYLRGLGFSAISLTLGPWGVPWGLWLTLRSLWTNLTGGIDVTEELQEKEFPKSAHDLR